MIDGFFLIGVILLAGALLILTLRYAGVPRYTCADCRARYTDHGELMAHERVHRRCLCGGDPITGQGHHHTCARKAYL